MTRLALVLPLLLSAACDSTLSTDLDNEDLRLFVHAEVGDDGELDVVAQVTTDNEALLEETYVDLTTGDFLFASVESTEVMMQREYIPVLGLIQYRATFLDVAGGDVLSVDLERDLFPDATGTSVVVPRAFELSVPSTFSRADGLVVAWTGGTADDSYLQLSGPCLDQSFSADGNPRRIDLSPPRLEVPEGVDPLETCEVTATVELSKQQSAAPEFGRGGRIEASQVRSQLSTATP